jgi:hypothetical protein
MGLFDHIISDRTKRLPLYLTIIGIENMKSFDVESPNQKVMFT